MLTDYMCEEKKEEEDLPALDIIDTMTQRTHGNIDHNHQETKLTTRGSADQK